MAVAEFEQVERETPYRFQPHSAEIEKVAAALAKAQGHFGNVAKSKTAKIQTREKGTYTYNFADLGDIMEMLRKPLADAQLSIVHFTHESADGLVLETRLIHTSGQWLATQLPLTGGSTPQALGSSITYMRRYSVGCLAGVVTEEDEDGQVAEAVAKKSAKKSPARKPAPKQGPKPPDPEATAEAQQKMDSKVFWTSVRNILRVAGITPAEDQNTVVREAMGAAGFEHTADMGPQDKQKLLTEMRAAHEPTEKF